MLLLNSRANNKRIEGNKMNNLKEQVTEFLEMLESDYEYAKGDTKNILKNYIADLKEILELEPPVNKDTLIKWGCENVKENGLGYEFTSRGFKFKLTHHTNDYGQEVNYWTIDGKRFDTVEDLRYYIKCL
jgi:hypothetical protein